MTTVIITTNVVLLFMVSVLTIIALKNDCPADCQIQTPPGLACPVGILYDYSLSLAW